MMKTSYEQLAAILAQRQLKADRQQLLKCRGTIHRANIEMQIARQQIGLSLRLSMQCLRRTLREVRFLLIIVPLQITMVVFRFILEWRVR